MPTLAVDVDAQVERLWSAAQRAAGGAMFNGHVFSADSIEPARLQGHWTEFRRVVAQMADPALFADLAVRPTATGGLLRCADGVVFGRRPHDAVYQAGMWQLPPAGSIDPNVARDDGTVDVLAQVFIELEEEMGLPRAAIRTSRLLCLVEHPGSHVLDLGIALDTDLAAADIRQCHAARGNGEYSELRIVAVPELAAVTSGMGTELTPQALCFLDASGLMPRICG